MTKEYDELKKDVYKEYLKIIETYKPNPLLDEIFHECFDKYDEGKN